MWITCLYRQLARRTRYRVRYIEFYLYREFSIGSGTRLIIRLSKVNQLIARRRIKSKAISIATTL